MTTPEDVKAIQADLKLIRESQIRIEASCVGCKEKLGNHDKTLYGNGRIGLKSQVTIMWWALGAVGTVLIGGGGLWVLIKVIAPHV